MKYPLLVITMFLLFSCDDRKPDFEFSIVNLSEDSVYVNWTQDDKYKPSGIPNIEKLKLLAPHESSKEAFWWRWNWTDHKMAVSFYKAETVRKLTWPVIQNRDTVDRVLFYTLEELQEAHYIIEYK